MACTVIQIGGSLFLGGGGGTISSCKINKICEIVFQSTQLGDSTRDACLEFALTVPFC